VLLLESPYRVEARYMTSSGSLPSRTLSMPGFIPPDR
jgi:hypothetical protein